MDYRLHRTQPVIGRYPRSVVCYLTSTLCCLCLCLGLWLETVDAQGREEMTPAAPSEPVAPKQKTLASKDKSAESSWRDWIKGMGARLKMTQGRVYLSSTAQRQSDDQAPVAEGEASLAGYGFSLASRPESGWQISPSIGVDSLLSVLRDEVSSPEQSDTLAGRVIGSSCSWADNSEGGSCLTSNMYEIEITMIYAGVWAGYVSPASAWPIWPSLNIQYKLGIEFNPLNVIWAQTRLNDIEMSDEVSFTWRGGLYLQTELLTEWKNSGWVLSLSTQLGQLATLSYSEPLEFRGAPYCDESGCSRRRTYSDETLLEMWSVCLSLIKTWD